MSGFKYGTENFQAVAAGVLAPFVGLLRNVGVPDAMPSASPIP